MNDVGAGQTETEGTIRVALIDDHKIVVDMTRAVLEGAGIIVMGVAYRLDQVPALLDGEPADVALVDYALPDGRGTEAIRRIRRTWPRCRAVLFTGYADSDVAEEAIAAGADGILTKSRGVDELLRIVRRAAAGDVLLDPAVLAGLAFRPDSSAAPKPISPLTDRERDVLEILLQEGDIEAASERLGITLSTYRVHLHHAMRKLGVDSRLEAISTALRAGVIRAPTPWAANSSSATRRER